MYSSYWLYIRGLILPAFGIPAGIGDIAIGVSAIPIAYLIRQRSSSKHPPVVWNLIGISDLLMAVSLGLMTASEFGISTMTTFPWILVPTVGVPLALVLHAITLYRMKKIES